MKEKCTFEFLPELMLRAPLYSFVTYDPELIGTVLNDTLFRQALLLASSDFYSVLEEKNFEYERLREKERHTLLKYYNRMCFRPVPFGAFASFTVVPWGRGESIHLVPAAEAKLFAVPEERAGSNVHLSGTALLQSNPLLYAFGKTIRFIRSEKSADGKYRFQLHGLQAEAFYTKFLKCLGRKRLQSVELVQTVSKMTSCTAAEAEHTIGYLKEEQVLIGEHSASPIETGGRISPVGWNEHWPAGQPFYSALERPCLTGAPGPEDQAELSGLLAFLQNVTTQAVPQGLQHFITAFEQRFDLQKVPLLLALDPDYGIGYENLTLEDGKALLRDINFPEQIEVSARREWSLLHTLLLRLWNKSGQDKYQSLQLKDLPDLEQLSTDGAAAASGAVVFRKAGDHLLVEYAGGSSAAAMAGRFTLFSEQVEVMCRTMAGLEQEANPDVIFADIGQRSAVHTDNINRRRQVYPYEIPLNVFSALPDDRQLPPSDLLLSVRNGQLILESVKHKKRIIPRLSSAFNHRHNELAVFRLLCDLQHQGVKTMLSIDPEHLFPGLDFYPRICFGQTVISLAKWKVGRKELDLLRSEAPDKGNIIRRLRKDLSLPRYVSVGTGDQQLVFDLAQRSEAIFLADQLRTLFSATITEYLVPDRFVKSEGRPLAGQFVAFYSNPTAVYRMVKKESMLYRARKKRTFWPGSEWLYLKIYCTATSADTILVSSVVPLLRHFRAHIDGWFFIRYQDPAPHLRLRFRLDSLLIGPVLNELRQRLEREGHDLVVRDYQSATYQRELERYPDFLIEDIEQAFSAGSELLLIYLAAVAKGRTSLSEVDMALITLRAMLHVFLDAAEDILTFCNKVISDFLLEFKGDKRLRTDMDKKFRELRYDIKYLFEKPVNSNYGIAGLKKHLGIFSACVQHIRQQAAKSGHTENYRLLFDLVHMQLNRIFRSDQRRQEMVVYYLFKKYLEAERGRARNAVTHAG